MLERFYEVECLLFVHLRVRWRWSWCRVFNRSGQDLKIRKTCLTYDYANFNDMCLMMLVDLLGVIG